MRIVNYICDNCNTTLEVEEPAAFTNSKKICPVCRRVMRRNWKTTNVIVPPHFQALNSLYNGDHGANYDYLKNRLRHGIRPSGKTRVLY